MELKDLDSQTLEKLNRAMEALDAGEIPFFCLKVWDRKCLILSEAFDDCEVFKLKEIRGHVIRAN